MGMAFYCVGCGAEGVKDAAACGAGVKWVVGRMVACSLLLIFSAVNWRGVKLGAWTVDGLTIAKVIPLVILSVWLLPSVEPARFTPFWSGEGRFGYAVFLALWALQGFEVAPIPAGETENP